MTDRAEIDAIYRDAVQLADQARGWFDGPGLAWRRSLAVDDQARVATASLATTARLMAAIGWALDPAHTAGGKVRFGGAGFNGLVYDIPAVLVDTPGGRIAAAAQRLFARIADYDGGAGSE